MSDFEAARLATIEEVARFVESKGYTHEHRGYESYDGYLPDGIRSLVLVPAAFCGTCGASEGHFSHCKLDDSQSGEPTNG